MPGAKIEQLSLCTDEVDGVLGSGRLTLGLYGTHHCDACLPTIVELGKL
jgi:hypothetical protein